MIDLVNFADFVRVPDVSDAPEDGVDGAIVVDVTVMMYVEEVVRSTPAGGASSNSGERKAKPDFLFCRRSLETRELRLRVHRSSAIGSVATISQSLQS